MAVIHSLKCTVLILTEDLIVTNSLSNSFRNSMFISEKVGSSHMRSFSVFRNSSHHKTNLLSKRLHFQNNNNYIDMRAAT